MQSAQIRKSDVPSNPDRAITAYAVEGGCACKLPWSELTSVAGLADPFGVSDVGQVVLSDGRLLLHTVDYGPPLVPDSEFAARIAVAHALSDIYAAGGSPITADIVLELPRSMPERASTGATLVRAMDVSLRGEGVNSIGGHTTVGAEIRLGVAVTGLASQTSVRSCAGARDGDLIVLSKPIGIGLCVNSVRAGIANFTRDEDWVLIACQSNKEASALLTSVSCRTATDVTGFGLLGSALTVARQSNVHLEIDWRLVPFFAAAHVALNSGLISPLAEDTMFLVATAGLVDVTDTSIGLALASPETSGGLLACVDPSVLPEVGSLFTVIGRVKSGEGVRVIGER